MSISYDENHYTTSATKSDMYKQDLALDNNQESTCFNPNNLILV